MHFTLDVFPPEEQDGTSICVLLAFDKVEERVQTFPGDVVRASSWLSASICFTLLIWALVTQPDE